VQIFAAAHERDWAAATDTPHHQRDSASSWPSTSCRNIGLGVLRAHVDQRWREPLQLGAHRRLAFASPREA